MWLEICDRGSRNAGYMVARENCRDPGTESWNRANTSFVQGAINVRNRGRWAMAHIRTIVSRRTAGHHRAENRNSLEQY